MIRNRKNSQARIRSTIEEYNRKRLSDESYVIMTACVASRDLRSHCLRTGHGRYINLHDSAPGGATPKPPKEEQWVRGVHTSTFLG